MLLVRMDRRGEYGALLTLLQERLPLVPRVLKKDAA